MVVEILYAIRYVFKRAASLFGSSSVNVSSGVVGVVVVIIFFLILSYLRGKDTKNSANSFLFAMKSAKRRAKVLRIVTFARRYDTHVVLHQFQLAPCYHLIRPAGMRAARTVVIRCALAEGSRHEVQVHQSALAFLISILATFGGKATKNPCARHPEG